MADRAGIEPPGGWVKNEFFWDSVFSEMLTSLTARRLTTIGGLCGSSISFAAAAVHRLAGPTVLVAPSVSQAESIRDDLRSILGDVLYFPAYETLPFEGEPAHPGVISDRVECMAELKSGSSRGIIVLPASALVKKVPPPENFSCFRLYRGMRLSIDTLEAWLLAAGYLREDGVWEQARWARRGGIVDVGTYGMENPVRLEFFGDELESLRSFDQRSQRSIRNLVECLLLPAREVILTPEHWNRAMEVVPEDHQLSEKLWTANDFPGIEHYLPIFLDRCVSILDYVGEDGTVILSDPEGIIGNMEEAMTFYRESYDPGKVPFGFSRIFFGMDEVKGCLDSRGRVVHFLPLPRGEVDVHYRILPQISFTGHRGEMLRQFRDYLGQGSRISVLCDSRAEEETFLELVPEDLDLDTEVLSISQGFRMPEQGLVVMAERGLLSGRRRPERVRRYRGGEGLADTAEISPGDLVVHRRYGIGMFTGLEQIETSGTILDCLAIEYRDGDRLLVPMHEIGSVQKFMAPDRVSPRLDKIGGDSWDRRVSAARRKATEIAGRLASLYAQRRAMSREPLEPPGHHVAALAESFPYEETQDQKKTIEKVMQDFRSDSPMDRLVCGDVGYGKTEVAIRAAFRAVDAGLQAAVLVPTTVLAEQHYFTFRDRLAEFPARIDMLSRFRTPAEQKKTIGDLALGEVDVIIGTHRLLQKDVRFHRLGLLVIDEEHRFGVRQKEYLRELRTGVDTLAMTATPIPRTLHMALSGFRDISIISTPPRDRYPIHTELTPFNPGIIARAVKRELERDGQVFFVHNRIQSIEGVREKLQSLLPRVSIVVAHGRMNPRQLENVMHDFMEHRYDVLLSTSIIESGLDLPRVNTMVIDNAHMFGLADLYQLRGRVGRSHHQAYCYLIVPEGKRLKPEAGNRLDAIRRFTELGSGWNIAMRDLEIRGAGELLGASQHGQMVSIGYSLFEELIREEAAQLKGVDRGDMSDVRVEIPGDSYIPPSYIPDVSERVRIYRSFWRAESERDIDGWTEYLKDRFGEPEDPVRNTVLRARMGYLARESGMEEVVVSGSTGRLVFRPGARLSDPLPASAKVRVTAEKTGRVVLEVALKGLSDQEKIARLLDLMRFLAPV
ncbi:MAG: transcription-repair coupling factor [Candidatus Fermentibacteraceae bacterium]|nr:transcription-repair coupling factor [Candidatus Fermentibacteraceae bacterium]